MKSAYLPSTTTPDQLGPRGPSANPARSSVSLATVLPPHPGAILPNDVLNDELIVVLRSFLELAEADSLALSALDGGAAVGFVVERGNLRFALVVDAARGCGLSPRELQIARLVADGATNRAIGSVLDISLWTVSTHLRRIFAKLGVGSRAEMVARLFGGPHVPATKDRRHGPHAAPDDRS
jgi:DNA-binding CsgD family transcriptional regulator